LIVDIVVIQDDTPHALPSALPVGTSLILLFLLNHIDIERPIAASVDASFQSSHWNSQGLGDSHVDCCVVLSLQLASCCKMFW
jgi:hypothetical protein